MIRPRAIQTQSEAEARCPRASEGNETLRAQDSCVQISTDPQSDVARARSWAAICVQDFDAPCVLQFAWVNALCCALHRSTSQVIHRSGSYIIFLLRDVLFDRRDVRTTNVPTSTRASYRLVLVRVSASDETALDGPSNCESLRRETGGVHASTISTRYSAATGRPVDSRVTRSCVRPGLRDVERSISGRIALNQDVRCPVPETRRSTVRCTRREARVSLLPRFRSAVCDLCTTVCLLDTLSTRNRL